MGGSDTVEVAVRPLEGAGRRLRARSVLDNHGSGRTRCHRDRRLREDERGSRQELRKVRGVSHVFSHGFRRHVFRRRRVRSCNQQGCHVGHARSRQDHEGMVSRPQKRRIIGLFRRGASCQGEGFRYQERILRSEERIREGKREVSALLIQARRFREGPRVQTRSPADLRRAPRLGRRRGR